MPTSHLIRALGRPGQPRAAVLEADQELAAGERDDDVPAPVRRRSHRDGAGSGRPRLPHAALPDARGHAAGPFASRDLDVRPLREAWMRLEQRPDSRQVGRIAQNDGVRIPNGHARDIEVSDTLELERVELSHLLLDPAVCEQARTNLAPARTND